MKRWPAHLWLSLFAVIFAVAVNIRACLRTSDPTPDQPPTGARR